MSSEASNSSEEVVARGYLQQMNIDDSYQQTRTGGWGFMARKKIWWLGFRGRKKVEYQLVSDTLLLTLFLVVVSPYVVETVTR